MNLENRENKRHILFEKLFISTTCEPCWNDQCANVHPPESMKLKHDDGVFFITPYNNTFYLPGSIWWTVSEWNYTFGR